MDQLLLKNTLAEVNTTLIVECCNAGNVNPPFCAMEKVKSYSTAGTVKAEKLKAVAAKFGLDVSDTKKMFAFMLGCTSSEDLRQKRQVGDISNCSSC